MHNPKLTLVGAGPGDPDLITIKAVKALRCADVVLYDALSNPELLKYAPLRAEKIFVGKRRGCYAYQQNEINELIVEKALQGNHVVRLKGGDSFIFGRGAEEMAYASKFGIETDNIPGLSSALAVPAAVNIPLTLRGVAESFWVITGTTRHHKLSNDVKLACQSSATVVILMGMGKLEQIMNLFQQEGKGTTPVAIIQNGTCENEKFVIGEVDTIVDLAEKQQLSNPAVILVGEVAKYHLKLQSISKQIAELAVA